MSRVPCFSATGKKKSGASCYGNLPKASSTTRRSAFDGTIKAVKNGSCSPRMVLSILSPVQWLKLRNFSCTSCGTIPVHNLLFAPEPVDRQPATLHGSDGRRIELHSVIYLETLKACEWSWPMFDQAVRRLMISTTKKRLRYQTLPTILWEARRKRSGSCANLKTGAA